MKLRFHSNSVRLRLSRTEVAQLALEGRVAQAVPFPAGNALEYSMEVTDAERITAALEGSSIRIQVPRKIAHQWIESDDAGIEESVNGLQVLIEKDFQCLHRSSGQDVDSFPNPLGDPQ